MRREKKKQGEWIGSRWEDVVLDPRIIGHTDFGMFAIAVVILPSPTYICSL